MDKFKEMLFIHKLAFLVLIIMILVAIFAPELAPYDSNKVQMDDRLMGISREHILGTDTLGRDILSRILYGARVSISLAFLATLLTMLFGSFVGIIAGYCGGIVDTIIQSIVNIFQGLPSLSFMIALAGVLGPGIKSLLIAIVFTSWAGFSRIVRGEVLKVKEEKYVEGARALGASHIYIILHYIIPNIFAPFIVLFAIRVGKSVLSMASLSFLGLGIQPPQADWGVMINDAKTHFRSYPNLLLAPGFSILLLCCSINLIGDALRDMFDEKSNTLSQYL
ncbi:MULTISPECIES: ABC transporter permease [unclassified Clostridioides]|uniref:ABC transporter permease n=1 Tax=unclassified Clostridioides TaxID=2635829 RepID=UPI001D0FF2CA|nr:ABC transporter permease [Clostridioides sp. ES-S-0049-02]MCC0706434.1 ABC transporter permease [Clostridioides sp. ES-S-0190-01]